jgi:hypothetical protein
MLEQAIRSTERHFLIGKDWAGDNQFLRFRLEQLKGSSP